MDIDYKDFARHMLGETPSRKVLHLKVSVPKTKILVPDNLAHGRRKRKKVVLQDLMDIKPTFQYTDAKDDVIDKAWQSWKARHRFSSATWDFLLSHPKAEYFKKRLRNDA